MLTFWLEQETGSSKIALQKALGNKAQVGNKQINWNFENLNSEWQNELINLINQLVTFREKFNALFSIGGGV